MQQTYSDAVLPQAIRSRFVDNVNGLTMHILEAGFEAGPRPLVVLLHGFPELAFSWRKVMPDLADAGYHVVAPDLRGYGRTSGWDVGYDDDLAPFRTLNMVNDIVDLADALGYRSVHAVIGHDYGSPLAAWCSIVRPDVFRSVVMMSAPFGTPGEGRDRACSDLANLNPSRKHYQIYYTTRPANENMWRAPQGVHAFLRAYYHVKSADWQGNDPHPLKSWSATELGKMPPYYIMPLEGGMAQAVAPDMPSPDEIDACTWLSDAELSVYGAEYLRTGFQGGLQGYRVWMDAQNSAELRSFSGRTIDAPSLFIAGKKDWGVYQAPGAFESMQATVCTQMQGACLVDGAGHWVQQEQPELVIELLLQFLGR